MSIVACHSSSTIAGQAAIQRCIWQVWLIPSSLKMGFGTSHSWTDPKGNIHHYLTSPPDGIQSGFLGAISIMGTALLHAEIHFCLL